MATAVPPVYENLLPSVRHFIAARKLMLIGEEWVEASDGATFETFDPSSGRLLAEVPEATDADVDRAVGAATRALGGPWSMLTARAREELIFKLADLVELHGLELAQIESLDSGKPYRQVEAVDVPLAVGELRYFGGWPTKLEGATIPSAVPGTHVYTRREPVGVVAAIVPWNFPLCQACYKIAPALAAGCTVILKPAEQTSLSALRLGELALEAGLPPGVLNVVTGVGEIAGRALVIHPGVAKIAFTGSEQVGKEIASLASPTLKHVSLELGGKSPNIIFADAVDLSAAAQAAATAIFFYAGQVCSAGSRLLVEASAYDDVVGAVVDAASGWTMGAGLSDETLLGPLISEEQRTRVGDFVDKASEQGAEIAYGGNRPGGDLEAGFFHQPTVIVGAKDHDLITQNEVFGPVLVAQPFDSVDDVARRANDTPYGLAAGIWTSDVRKAHALSAKLDAGTVWVNTYNLFDPAVPWGGFKQSGYGRDCGREGVEKYLQTKAVWINYA